MMDNSGNKNLASWLLGGVVKSPAPAQLNEQLKIKTEQFRTIQLDPFGSFFFSKPGYLDWAENEQMLVAKIGFVRLKNDFISASELLNSGLMTPLGVDYEYIHGNALVFCCDKLSPQFCAYKTLLSVQQLFYTEIDDALIIANNLGAIAEFTRNNRINPKAIPLHFIYRSVPGQLTYFANIYRLRPGEELCRNSTSTRIVLRKSLRSLVNESHNKREIRPETINVFFDQVKDTMASYLKVASGTGLNWSMLLSGGIDSSVLQMAINSQSVSQGRIVSHTFAPAFDSFTPEIDYARTASSLFSTEHTFVPIPVADYPTWLNTTIRILGQPPHHESTAFLPALLDYIVKNDVNIKYLFSAQGADALFGMGIAENVTRATRYQYWPPVLLSLWGVLLRPISQSESYRTRLAAKALRQLKEKRDSHQYLLNAQSAYTDWQMVHRNFGRAEISEAFAYRRQQEIDYLDSDNIIEKTQTVDLLSESYDTAGIDHQLSLAYDRQVIFPFLDEELICAAFSFNARDRYFMGGRTKPILKQILEMGPAASITKALKRGGGFRADLFNWMQKGNLRDFVSSINRPGFMSQGDFQRIIESPNWYTWNLLTFDLFEKLYV